MCEKTNDASFFLAVCETVANAQLNGNSYKTAVGRTFYPGAALIGIDAVFGQDYTCKAAPVNLSIGLQPWYEFGLDRGFYGNRGGLSLRYSLEPKVIL